MYLILNVVFIGLRIYDVFGILFLFGIIVLGIIGLSSFVYLGYWSVKIL